MNLLSRAALSLSLALLGGSAWAAPQSSDFTGRWEVTTSYPGGVYVAGLKLSTDAGRYTGQSAYLVPDMYWFKYGGGVQKDGLHLQILAPDGTTVIGNLVLQRTGNTLSGTGVLRNIPLKLSGHRPLTRPADTPRVHTFDPQVY